MSHEMLMLLGLAASIGFIHTLMGPDHYVPFIVMSRARQWSLGRTAGLTFLCGLGHVLGSVVLGAIGVAVGVAVGSLEWFEAVRGDVAAWLLTGFGLAYLAWGLWQGIRNRPHRHIHVHDGGELHEHEHVHEADHAHAHGAAKRNITPWVLFTIFVFGPCEPLIPILMYPAARQVWWGVVLVAALFGVVTIATMMGMVVLATFGINILPTRKLERWMHALAGGAVFACGLAIHLGL
jgi:sulfite exporter TauE/SafE